jgi:hypothetical protein
LRRPVKASAGGSASPDILVCRPPECMLVSPEALAEKVM